MVRGRVKRCALRECLVNISGNVLGIVLFALGSECWESVVVTRISFVIVLNPCVVLMEGSCIN